MTETRSGARQVVEADYWQHYYLGHEVTYKWNDGVLEEKGGSDDLTFRVFDGLIRRLAEFLQTHPIADRVALEMGFRLALPQQERQRAEQAERSVEQERARVALLAQRLRALGVDPDAQS